MSPRSHSLLVAELEADGLPSALPNPVLFIIVLSMESGYVLHMHGGSEAAASRPCFGGWPLLSLVSLTLPVMLPFGWLSKGDKHSPGLSNSWTAVLELTQLWTLHFHVQSYPDFCIVGILPPNKP